MEDGSLEQIAEEYYSQRKNWALDPVDLSPEDLEVFKLRFLDGGIKYKEMQTTRKTQMEILLNDIKQLSSSEIGGLGTRIDQIHNVGEIYIHSITGRY